MSEKVVTAIAAVELPEYLEEFDWREQNLTIKDDQEWDGHAYGACIGRKYTGTDELRSFIVKDKESESGTELFAKILEDVDLIEKRRTIRRVGESNGELTGVIDYFIPYEIKSHRCYLPTVVDNHVDNCSNVHYDYTYEIMFIADEGFRKYIYVDISTGEGFAMTLVDRMERLEAEIEEMIDEGSNGLGWYDPDDRSQDIQAVFYDDVGEKLTIDLMHRRELMAMINSVRLVKLEREIIPHDKVAK